MENRREFDEKIRELARGPTSDEQQLHKEATEEKKETGEKYDRINI